MRGQRVIPYSCKKTRKRVGDCCSRFNIYKCVHAMRIYIIKDILCILDERRTVTELKLHVNTNELNLRFYLHDGCTVEKWRISFCSETQRGERKRVK